MPAGRRARSVSSNEGGQFERRIVIASVFVAALLAIAFQEMVNPVRESIHAQGFTLGTAALFVTFFFTTIRFFIGMQLHLTGQALKDLPGGIWLYDFIVIMFETTIIIFMGGVSSPEASLAGRIGFVGLLISLLCLDCAWVVSQWGLGRLFKNVERPSIPWRWAILNAVVVALLLLPRFFGLSYYSSPPLMIWLAVLGIAAFLLDVGWADVYDLI